MGDAFSDTQAIDLNLAELESIAAEANHLHCQLKIPDANSILEGFIRNCLQNIFFEGNFPTDSLYIEKVEQVLDLIYNLSLDLFLDPLQELYFSYFKTYIIPACIKLRASHQSHSSSGFDKKILDRLLKLGQSFGIDVREWLF